MKTEIIYSVKPSQTGVSVYTPERRAFDKSVVSCYIVNGRYSGKDSELRRTHLRNKRNLNKFTVALFPFIAERYDNLTKSNA